MKHKGNNYTASLIGLAVIFCFVFLLSGFTVGSTFSPSKQGSRTVTSGNSKRVIGAFQKRVKEYVKLREKLEGKLPAQSNDSTPEQIQAHKTAFEEKVRAARVNAKAGDIFTPDITKHIRATIKAEFKGHERAELRETILEADTKGVALRVNYPYPETKELTQIPPTLLLKLPELPKQVKYRFVERHMLLVDRENGLIIDYMLNALP